MSWNRVGVLWVGALCALLAACGDDEGSKADRSDGGDGGDGGGGLTSTGGAAGGVVGGSGGGGNVSVDVDRFADGAMWWSLPPGFENDKMDDLAEDSGDPCIQGAFSAATMDMTGDGIPDLVVTDNCDEQGVGSTEWLVFPGGSGGFTEGMISWALPPGFDNDKMDDLGEDSGDPCIQGAFSAATMDMTGDGIPDLVVTDNCDEQGVGSTEWLVFPGGSGGFTEGMISWALPTGFDNDKMDDLGEDSGDPCIQGAFSAATVDMTGDGAPDLVVTDNCDEQGTGSTEWLIFPAVGGGA